MSTKPAMYLWQDPPSEVFNLLWAGDKSDCPRGFAFWIDGRWVEPKPGHWAKLVEMLPNGTMSGRMISAQLMEDPDGRRYWRPVTFGNERDRAGTEGA